MRKYGGRGAGGRRIDSKNDVDGEAKKAEGRHETKIEMDHSDRLDTCLLLGLSTKSQLGVNVEVSVAREKAIVNQNDRSVGERKSE